MSCDELSYLRPGLVKNKFYNGEISETRSGGLDPFPRHDFTTAFRDETYDDLISLGCSRYDHMLIPGGPGFAKGVTLSIIDSETWSGKPEPGISLVALVME
jgi:hypothetical protein